MSLLCQSMLVYLHLNASHMSIKDENLSKSRSLKFQICPGQYCSETAFTFLVFQHTDDEKRLNFTGRHFTPYKLWTFRWVSFVSLYKSVF